MNENHKRRHFEISPALLLRNQNYSFLNQIVTCDEKWILHNNRKRLAQWLDADNAPQHFSKPKLHQKKVIVTGWLFSAGLIHHSFIKSDETITEEKYCRKIDEMY